MILREVLWYKDGFSDSKSQKEGKQPGDLPEVSKGCFSPERPVWLVVNNTDLGQTDFALILILGPICILRTNSPHTDCSHKPHLLYCREAAMRKSVIHPIHPTNSVHYQLQLLTCHSEKVYEERNMHLFTLSNRCRVCDANFWVAWCCIAFQVPWHCILVQAPLYCIISKN